ncbi:MAG: DUF4345 domain-containing protein [Cyclobacteriaceae bacterium]|nr:DUF4345 domain-containing protein [Cyclobacteriaceae bacterium]
MKKEKLIRKASLGFVALSSLSILAVSAMAFVSPQSVMDLVAVKLTNTDAVSSIRGIYGGAGLTIVIALVYLSRKDIRESLAFLILLWGLYALSRMITWMTDGPLGDFGTQWILLESIFCGIGMLLWMNEHRKPVES